MYANLEAIKQNVRFTEKNMNRCFLKEQNGNIYEEKRAKEIMEILDKSDYLLDIHNTISFNSSLEILITTHVDYSKYFSLNKIITHIDNAQE
ncbi:MAG: succinylglutamate desuccinylase/aspartoacylase family protein [Patescibacteria group bacterium]|nr:succinylglutamate desuccinylase/aspartoacylase family protein [Patescibacteria group bacterium]